MLFSNNGDNMLHLEKILQRIIKVEGCSYFFKYQGDDKWIQDKDLTRNVNTQGSIIQCKASKSIKSELILNIIDYFSGNTIAVIGAEEKNKISYIRFMLRDELEYLGPYKLYYHSIELEDHLTLMDYDIVIGNTLTVKLQARDDDN